MVLSDKSPLAGIFSGEAFLGEKTISSRNRRWRTRTQLGLFGHPHMPVGVGAERRVIQKMLGGKPPDNSHMAGKQQKLLELAITPSFFPFQNSPEESPGMCSK